MLGANQKPLPPTNPHPRMSKYPTITSLGTGVRIRFVVATYTHRTFQPDLTQFPIRGDCIVRISTLLKAAICWVTSEKERGPLIIRSLEGVWPIWLRGSYICIAYDSSAPLTCPTWLINHPIRLWMIHLKWLRLDYCSPSLLSYVWSRKENDVFSEIWYFVLKCLKNMTYSVSKMSFWICNEHDIIELLSTVAF